MPRATSPRERGRELRPGREVARRPGLARRRVGVGDGDPSASTMTTRPPVRPRSRSATAPRSIAASVASGRASSSAKKAISDGVVLDRAASRSRSFPLARRSTPEGHASTSEHDDGEAEGAGEQAAGHRVGPQPEPHAAHGLDPAPGRRASCAARRRGRRGSWSGRTSGRPTPARGSRSRVRTAPGSSARRASRSNSLRVSSTSSPSTRHPSGAPVDARAAPTARRIVLVRRLPGAPVRRSTARIRATSSR